ncbi:unnamed protein product [Adineta steineri]|uniref:G-protein coupled receptors family 1 profile domain-containing protein n=1 Tax=Adineta steineri TaxID=433720 RepID=A0A813P2W4_9BILA|nr:unnamed protein product [Adineta steineri]CAF0720028.1 unnamed protein product [Adineta steineri]CAF0749003.1 unnamed protein product [Adineta steineri]CAF3496456.1 unnamed protein product [Adineta steineri]CAF3604552.1 unnamed protein product [Adineta steineri]
MNCSTREEIARHIELYTYPFLLGIGTVGNLLSIVVLIQMRQHSVYRYLTFMAIADTVLLYIGLLRELLLSSSFQMHIQGTLLCKLHVFFFYNTLHLSSWFRCCLNLDRYVAVKFPIYTSKWCRTRQASINSSIVFVVLSLSNVHLLIFVHGDDGNNHNLLNISNFTGGSTVNPFQYQRCYLHPNYVHFFEQIYTWIDMFLVTIIPFIFIILCNLTVINRVFLVSSPSKKSEIVSRSKATNRLRSLCLMMICSSFVFVATTLPVTAFIIDLLSHKASIDVMRCRRIQWTVYNILMYFNYASILSYCLSGTEFRHVLMKTIHFRTKPSLASMFHTDMMNAVNQRRTSTPQQFHRVLVEYQGQQRFRSSSVSVLPVNKKDTKDQHHMLKITPTNTKYLQIQQPDYHNRYRHSCTSQTNCGGVTVSSTIQSPLNTRWKSSYATNNQHDILDPNDDVNSNDAHSKLVFC